MNKIFTCNTHAMKVLLTALLFNASFLLSLSVLQAQQSKPKKVDASHIVVNKDLEVTLWAQTPLFNNPTNMDMDAHGRMWVAEGVNYRKHPNRRPEGDRIMVLTDSDNDGKADKSHCFVQEAMLRSPLGVSVFGNRIVVAQPPELIVYTDVDGDLKFDPKVDKREVLLTGFNGAQHDHSLHAVTAGPDGKWYVNQGNTGGKFTDKSGKTFRFGSSYKGGYSAKNWPNNPTEIAGKKSDDGFVWIGGFIGKMNPDGSDMHVLGHNMRNPYEHTVNSFGDVFHSDNDDPPACRNTYLLEGGNAGFCSADGKYGWAAERRPGQDTPTAHWRQENPGVMPAGDVYGSGSPTGVAFYENGALPKSYNGMFLAADAGRRDIMQYFPKPKGGGYSLDRKIFLKTDDNKSAFNFRPSDVEVGADGAIYVCDWYDQRVGGHNDLDHSLSGAIYRIAPKGFKAGVKPDFKSLEGQIALLRSPSDNVRFLGFELLRKRGASALPAIKKLISDKNPYIAARGVWLLPYLGNAAISDCESLLKSSSSDMNYTAFNALRAAGKLTLKMQKQMAVSKSPQVRRAVASSLRTMPIEQKSDLLVTLYKNWDGMDKYMLDAMGLACIGDESALWSKLVKLVQPKAVWDDKFSLMTWRLHPEEAIPMLEKRASDLSLTETQRKLAIDTVAFVEGAKAPASMLAIYKADGPQKGYAQMWLNMNLDGKQWDGLIDRNLVAKEGGVTKPGVASTHKHPQAPEKRDIPTVAEIKALKGDAKRGEIVSNRCIMCHEIGDKGASFGPGLTGWGATRNTEQILNAILTPDADIAHGFKGHRLQLREHKVIDGLMKSSPERPKAGGNANAKAYAVVVTVGGVQQKINWNYILSVKPMERSLMLYPEQLGLTDAQDLADLVVYLQQLKPKK